MVETEKTRGTITIRYPVTILGIRTKRILLFLFCFAIVLFLFLKVDWTAIMPTRSSTTVGKDTSKVTIFVSLASYRDIYCMKTLQHLFSQAKHPERIFVGVVQQNSDRDPDCQTVEGVDNRENVKDLQTLLKYRDHVRVLRMEYREAKGPVYARFLAVDRHYRGEDFIFQIDSHIRFIKNWDEVIVNNVMRLPPKSCISHYPMHFEPDTGTFNTMWKTHVTRFCRGFFNNDEILQPEGGVFTFDGKSYEGPFLAAGMTFYPGSAATEVPIDPHLKHLFHGEELLYSIRMAAAGYKFYSPAENVCFHFYTRKEFPKSWDANLRDSDYFVVQRHALQRTKYILGMLEKSQLENTTLSLPEIDKYGINRDDPQTKKNVDDYLEKFGINFKEKKIKDLCKSGEFPSKY